MGNGSSSLPERLDAPTVALLAGKHWDAGRFARLRGPDGLLSKQQLFAECLRVKANSADAPPHGGPRLLAASTAWRPPTGVALRDSPPKVPGGLRPPSHSTLSSSVLLFFPKLL